MNNSFHCLFSLKVLWYFVIISKELSLCETDWTEHQNIQLLYGHMICKLCFSSGYRKSIFKINVLLISHFSNVSPRFYNLTIKRSQRGKRKWKCVYEKVKTGINNDIVDDPVAPMKCGASNSNPWSVYSYTHADKYMPVPVGSYGWSICQINEMYIFRKKRKMRSA